LHSILLLAACFPDQRLGASQGFIVLILRAGNNYSINNWTEKPARIFFAQGCEVEAEA